MKDEYIIINRTAIQKRIEELEVLKRIHCYRGPQPNENEFQRYNIEQSTLKQILSQSTPLIPENIDKILSISLDDINKFHEDEYEKYQEGLKSRILERERYINMINKNINGE